MTPNWDPPEHPEDRSQRIRREAYGRAHAATFARAHMRTMTRLIEVYSDADAVDALEGLRSLFWAEQWSPEQTEPHQGTPVATSAQPDTGQGSGPATGVPSCGSPPAPSQVWILVDEQGSALSFGPSLSEDQGRAAARLVVVLDHRHYHPVSIRYHRADVCEESQASRDRFELLRIVDELTSERGRLEQEKSQLLGSLGDSEEDAARAQEKLQETQQELAASERKYTNVSMDLAEAKGDLERARAFAAELTVREAELAQDLAFERAKNEGRVLEGGGL